MKLKYIIDKKYDLEFGRNNAEKNFIQSVYRTNLKLIKNSQKMYQLAWDEINDDFSDYIEKITGYKWFYDEYCCVVSVLHQGLSNWGDGPKIVRWFHENHYTQRRVTAYELIISHCFEIYNHHYQDYKLTKKQVWAFAEVVALFLTSFTKKGKSFWPWDFSEYYMDNTYEELIDYQKKMKDIFSKQNKFDKYILSGLKEAKKLKLS